MASVESAFAISSACAPERPASGPSPSARARAPLARARPSARRAASRTGRDARGMRWDLRAETLPDATESEGVDLAAHLAPAALEDGGAVAGGGGPPAGPGQEVLEQGFGR